MANDNKHVKMKIVDDKLKIIDDVPTSAVEMAVKEKVCKTRQFDDFLKILVKTFIISILFSVLEKSPKTRADCRGDQITAQATLQ